MFFISILISYQNLNNLKFKLIENLFPSNEEIILKYLIETQNKQERLNVDFKQNQYHYKTNIKKSKQIIFKNTFKKRGIIETPCLNISSIFPFGIIKHLEKYHLKKK